MKPVTIRDAAAEPILSIRGRCPAAGIGAWIGEAIGELYQYVGQHRLAPEGPPFAIYHTFGSDEVDVEVALGVRGDAAAEGRVISRVLPAATLAETEHDGAYDTLSTTYAGLDGWVAEHGFHAAGPTRESYRIGPDAGVAPAEYRTDIAMPIAPALIAVES